MGKPPAKTGASGCASAAPSRSFSGPCGSLPPSRKVVLAGPEAETGSWPRRPGFLNSHLVLLGFIFCSFLAVCPLLSALFGLASRGSTRVPLCIRHMELLLADVLEACRREHNVIATFTTWHSCQSRDQK